MEHFHVVVSICTSNYIDIKNNAFYDNGLLYLISNTGYTVYDQYFNIYDEVSFHREMIINEKEHFNIDISKSNNFMLTSNLTGKTIYLLKQGKIKKLKKKKKK